MILVNGISKIEKGYMDKIEFLKHIALLEEFETAAKLVELGLGELQNISLVNDFYFLPLQLLSQGFERFMKAYVCVGYFEKTGALPDSTYLKGFGHNLKKLLFEITEKYWNHYQREQFESDRVFLSDNTEFQELLSILSEFGKLARYHNFDFITDNSKISIDPKEAWLKFESKVMSGEDSMKKLMNNDLEQEVYYEIASHIVVIFERFLSALSRQIIFGTLGQVGKQLTISSFYDFGLLYDGEFGRTDYRKNTTRYKETPKSVHKRTLFDYIDRKFNPNFKSQKITKYEYEGDWPFYADEVVIECRDKHWCIITINGYDYALNGSAKGRYKLENPHEAGMAIIGKSIGDFIKMALELK